MNSEDPRGSRSGLSAAAGVVAMLAVVAIVLGAGFLLTRQLLQAGVSSTTTEASSPDRTAGSKRATSRGHTDRSRGEERIDRVLESAETPGVVPIRISAGDAQQPAAAELGHQGRRASG